MLKQLLKKYEPLSLAKSIYTITSWVNNRNYLGFSDSLNLSFLAVEEELKTTGKSIESHEEFSAFFEDLIAIVGDVHHVEAFPVDTGEVVFYNEGTFYKTIIGNGSEDIYEIMFFLNEITNHDEHLKDIWKEILLYEHNLLTNLYVNKHNITNEFECPPLEYFTIVCDNFNQFINDKLHNFFHGFQSENEELYALFSKNKGYPVFLPVMKDIFVEKLERDIDRGLLTQSKWNSIKNQLKSNYLSLKNYSNWFVDSLSLIDKDSNSIIELDLSFMIVNQEKAAIFIPDNVDTTTMNILQNEIIGRYIVRGKNTIGELIGIEFQKTMNILLLRVSDSNLSSNIMKNILLKEDEYYISYVDIMGIINFSTTLEEIIDFFEFIVLRDREHQIINCSGTTSYFQIWQKYNRFIVEGALEHFIFVPSYQSVERTIDFFSEDIVNYPFYGGRLYSNVHRWNFSRNEYCNLYLEAKNLLMSSTVISFQENAIIYSQHTSIVEDFDKDEIIIANQLSDIMLYGLNKFSEDILYLTKTQYIDLNIVSQSTFMNYSQNGVVVRSKYYEKVIIKTVDEKEVILIKPNWEKIKGDSLSSKTRLFENELILSVFEGLYLDDYESLVRKVKKTDNELRTSVIKLTSVPYYIDLSSKFRPPVPSSFKQVRKIMSHIVKEIGLEAGVYEEHEIPGIVRRFRNQIRNSLVKKIVKFNHTDLIKKVLNIYSILIFETDFHHKRLDTFGSGRHLYEDKLTSFREETIKSREITRTYRYVLEYLVEEIIANKNDSTSGYATKQDIEEMVAFSKWIFDFQIMSDSIHYGATNWAMLEIRKDFIVEIAETKKQLEYIDLLTDLKYEFGDYSLRDNELDKTMFDKIRIAFETDTNVSFDALVITLRVLYSNENVEHFNKSEKVKVISNIVEAPLEIVAERFLEDTILPLEDFYKVISFIMLDSSRITDENGIIPLWEKKKREFKISAKPLLYYDDKILYSPVTLYELERDWTMGMLNFMLPYNIGLERTFEVLQEWKTKYEHIIVEDLASLFTNEKYVVYQDIELHKLDPKGNHPKTIGDFDLIVINKERLRVILVEVKYMRMSQTVKDSLGDQKDYFIGKKPLAIKFEKKIEYFEDNKYTILTNLGFMEDYTIESYFVTNKNIRSLFKEFKFKILSFNQFKSEHLDD